MPAVRVESPTNIAMIKYWGKHPRYEDLFIPTKSSISFTVSGLFASTLLTVDPGDGIEFRLNGKKIAEGKSEFAYVKEFFDKIYGQYEFSRRYAYRIESQNNFPTASGFASSAAGFSALALAFARAMMGLGHFPKLDDRQLSVIARLGSGSAARSIPSKGGLVIWHRGYDGLGSPTEVSKHSYAETLYRPSYFKELAIIYAKVESGEKEIKSRAGMKESVKSVYDYWQWVDYEERTLLPAMLESVKRRDWKKFFGLTKQASNNFHSVCLRTVPPIMYLNDASMEIIKALDPLDHAAYTFDAGPNAVVFTLKSKADEVEGFLRSIVGKANTFVTGVGGGPTEIRP